jgi:hypothetical protein
MWPFKRKKASQTVHGEAIRYLRADDWEAARRAFQHAEGSLSSLPPPQQVQVLLGRALCHLASGHNAEARKVFVRARPLAPAGTNAAKFVGVLEKACDKDFFADPLMVPPTGGADFDFANIVPAEVSFLKHSFLQLLIDG